MPSVSPFSTRFAAWRALESRVDRWSSLAALGLGMAAPLLFLAL